MSEADRPFTNIPRRGCSASACHVLVVSKINVGLEQPIANWAKLGMRRGSLWRKANLVV